jgi:hypothetical protein
MVVVHSPATRIVRYRIALNPDSSLASFEQSITLADGSPAPQQPTGMKISFTGDTAIREMTPPNGSAIVRRTPVPAGTLPSIGGSYLAYELGIAEARRTNAGAYLTIGLAAQQSAPTRFAVTFIGNDSAEVDSFGSPIGFRLDASGRIRRGDGARTTQKVVISAIGDVPLGDIAARWAARDAAGHAMGLSSPRDTTGAVVGDARITIEYGRPARRGRDIWGGLVAWGEVWRLGANAATQFTTTRDLDVGGILVPAGHYSLWLLPAATHAELIVNAQTGQWGTEYHAEQDVVRIPLEPTMGQHANEERLTLAVIGGELVIRWGTGGYRAKVQAK